jgi:hypothetical protein
MTEQASRRIYTDCGRCSGTGDDPEGILDWDGVDGPIERCRQCHGRGVVPLAVDREAIARAAHDANGDSWNEWDEATPFIRGKWLTVADAVLALLGGEDGGG